MAGIGHNTATYIHHLAEAMKLAVADRAKYAPAPNPPTEGLLSKEYAANRRSLIDQTHAGVAAATATLRRSGRTKYSRATRTRCRRARRTLTG